jgi:oxygen-independent coproporphyrinogen-3 oxidase
LARAARAPRYTSYPTANHFSAAVGPEFYDTWLAALPEEASLSLYLHVPFCDQMCWYCACTTKATKRYAPIAAYLDTLEAEMARIAERLPAFHRVKHIHLGGGSPDILSPEDMRRLGERLHTLFRIDPDAEFAIEQDQRRFGGNDQREGERAGRSGPVCQNVRGELAFAQLFHISGL